MGATCTCCCSCDGDVDVVDAEKPQVVNKALSSLVDVNVASEDLLCTLPGITRAKARAIVARRNEVGRFAKLWDLTAIPGIGEATVRGIQKLVAPLVDTPQEGPVRRLRHPLTCPIQAHGEAAVVVMGTWNIRRLSLSKPDFALHIIAGVIQHMDLVAIQEVMDPRALQKLLMLLPGWNCVTSPAQGTQGSVYCEQYAVLFNAARVSLTGDAYVASALQVSRPPMVSHFVARSNAAWRVSVINFHAVYGTKASERTRECCVVQQFAEDMARNGATTCLLGDFNVPSDGVVWKAWQAVGSNRTWTPVLTGTGTTLSGSAFDNIWIAHGVLVRGQVYCYSTDIRLPNDTATEAVSDHYPVVAAIRVGSSPKQATHMPDNAERCTVTTPGDTWYAASVLWNRYQNTSTQLLV